MNTVMSPEKLHVAVQALGACHILDLGSVNTPYLVGFNTRPRGTRESPVPCNSSTISRTCRMRGAMVKHIQSSEPCRARRAAEWIVVAWRNDEFRNARAREIHCWPPPPLDRMIRDMEPKSTQRSTSGSFVGNSAHLAGTAAVLKAATCVCVCVCVCLSLSLPLPLPVSLSSSS